MEQSQLKETEPTNKSAAALREEAVLIFWKENGIFEKSLEKESPKGEFVFYEGPPTANAKPALHHLEARAFKDVLPRYKTMQGFHVRRRAGWDTHGLPVELQIEKKLGLASKKNIEKYGIAQFNRECKESVFTYIKDWETFTDRIGYWVDKKDAYYTFDTNYMESLWNIFSNVNDQNLLYKDYKVVPWCARCGTVLASHELAQGYQDDKDLTVTAKFELVDVPNAYFLAWTTTPWTLPGNVGLAVGSDIDYVEAKVGEQIFVLAKERLNVITERYEIVAEHKGSEMVGMKYKPLYPYLSELIKGHHQEKNMENAYQVYAADFVTTTDGTGIVHTAVMYGQEDFELGTKVGLPKFHTVSEEGKFIAGTDFLEGRFVKDEEVAVDIIKDLAHRGLLFKKEKYEHSYPHCWRCKTALIYYARDSWYIKMSDEKIKSQLIEQNQQINWEPSHIRDGRFGEWLKDIKDWAISRERYWGTPLPIWQHHDERIVVDSIATLKKYAKKSGNNYFVMRHGQTENNVHKIWNVDEHKADPLTQTGEEKTYAAAQQLKDKKIDLIIASPFPRTQQTAQIIAASLGLSEKDIVSDVRLSEWKVGKDFDGKAIEDYFTVRNASTDRYQFKAEDGESYADILKRSGEFLYELEEKYAGKNILIVSHGAVTRALALHAEGVSFSTLFEQTRAFQNFDNAEVRAINFTPLPHNDNYELDLHRPYIDSVVLEKNGKNFHRVKEVMDVWFDSGSMPFAQDHYPFEKNELLYPADFISEAIDQTRGWFYTMHAVGVLMGKGKAYKNVICLGHLLDKEGKKMSKSIGNIVEPFSQIDMFGVDSVRLWMYSVNQPGESKNYDEKTVAELQRQVFGLLYNVFSFYELYRDSSAETEVPVSEYVLDVWIRNRLRQFVTLTTESLDAYNLFEPVRALRDFIDDLSTWYLRRSRDRIKNSDHNAKRTLYAVLMGLIRVMAPFTPFTAEDMWQKLRRKGNQESVHLENWPQWLVGDFDKESLLSMQKVRVICTLGNALRKKVAIGVRQPLAKLEVKDLDLSEEYLALIMEELNVKEVVGNLALVTEAEFDTTITPELKAEGNYRELIRAVQDMRKAKELLPSDMISLSISPAAETFLAPFLDEFKKTVQATEVKFSENEGEEVIIDDMRIRVSIEK